ncbi:uncharacterized protein LOC131023572 [Salvia miltiorrhiza]|uniref:uncharacterized protein LOC131023572 n=1 Tax=Salvia miltiorrhiza TaxID=226208 RepID=UPI0025AD7A83|nr:uncharacterized protein LOC131023572 [Salvia miltiorrhiza]
MGMFREGEWVWSFMWERAFNFSDFVNFVELWFVLYRISLRHSVSDSILWKGANAGKFSTKEMYSNIHKAIFTANNSPVAFKDIWAKGVPIKVSSFAWRALLDRIPTRENLLKRGIMLGNGGHCCPLCSCLLESTDHLLLLCMFSVKVWELIYKWMNISPISSVSLLEHFNEFVEQGENKKGKLMCNTIWQCVCWKI